MDGIVNMLTFVGDFIFWVMGAVVDSYINTTKRDASGKKLEKG